MSYSMCNIKKQTDVVAFEYRIISFFKTQNNAYEYIVVTNNFSGSEFNPKQKRN